MKKNIIVLVVFFCIKTVWVFGQKNIESNTVEDIIKKSHDMYANLQRFRFEADYKSFGSYDDTEILENYNGKMIRDNKQVYLRINNTIFLNSQGKNLKIYGDEKVIEAYKEVKQDVIEQSPIFITEMLNHYKHKDFEETSGHFICTLQTGYLTQMPYGKIVIYVNKKTYAIERQIFYMLAKLPYVSNKTGERKIGNPRIEIELKNFKTTISDQELNQISLSNYVKTSGSKLTTVGEFKDFTIEYM